jgi:uncharacterized protein with GYD domain
MAIYMTQVAYTPEHLAALAKEPRDRTEDISALAKRFDGKLLGFWYGFGEYDGVAIVEAPDEKAMTGFIATALGAGHIRATKTTVLMTPKDAMDALRRVGSVPYQAPGGKR